jgi:cell division transport system permease protein
VASDGNPEVRSGRARRGLFESLGIYFERHAQTLVASLGRMTRQPMATLMTIAVIGIALALPAALGLLVANARAATGSWDSAIELSVFFKEDVRIVKAEQLARTLRERSGVASVELIPADAALKEFREFSDFGAALDALTDNPLPHALIVRPASGHASPAEVDAPSAIFRPGPRSISCRSTPSGSSASSRFSISCAACWRWLPHFWPSA